MMLQQDHPEDYVISTGNQYSVREFVQISSNVLGMNITWKGKDESETGFFNGKAIVKVDKRYYRPTEVESLLGDSSKAKHKLGWEPKIKFEELVHEMTIEDLKKAENESKNQCI